MNGSLKYFAALLLFIQASQLKANDGVFYARGNTLFPVKETEIRMDKEFLSLTREGDFVNIVVQFEFFNPGGAKELVVGFVTPPGSGDIEEEEAEHPQIQDFTVQMNGLPLKWSVARVNGTGYQLSEDIADENEFLYHFTAPFKSGLNRIQHTYRFKATEWVEAPFIAEYVLTTGTTWAGGEIGDFTLEINMGENIVFTLPWSFSENGEPAPWRLEGSGALATDKRNFIDRPFKVVSMEKGKVVLHQTHFRPQLNLDIYEFYIHNEVYLWMPNDTENPLSALMFEYMIFEPVATELIDTYTAEQLRLFRNFLYARQGYSFQDKALKALFDQCIWYRPRANLRMEDIVLPARDQALLIVIQNSEKKLQGGR